MAVIADFPNYPHVGRLGEAGRGARGRAGRAGAAGGVRPRRRRSIRDQYELTYVWTGDRKVEWKLTSGQMMRAQHGSYTLRADGAARTHVTYSLTVDLIIPMLGLLKRKAERVVMDQALKELKKRVE